MRPIRIRLDLAKPAKSHDVVRIRQGELNATVLEAVVTDGGEPVADLGDYAVYFECRHPHGAIHQDDLQLTVEGSVIRYVVDERVGSEVGAINVAYFALHERGLRYEWERSTDGGETWHHAPEAGSRTPCLHYCSVPATYGHRWRCRVAAPDGTVAVSGQAGFDLRGRPVLLAQEPSEGGEPPAAPEPQGEEAGPFEAWLIAPDTGRHGSLTCATSLDGTPDAGERLYATTGSFLLEVLPNAETEGCGVAEAYSSKVEEMLRDCAERFDLAEADRDRLIDEAVHRADDAAARADAAANRANAAADTVQDAIDGTLDPVFGGYLESKKDVPGGFESWENHVRTRVVADGETIERDEETAEISVKPGSLGDEHIRDEGLTFAKIAAILPFMPRTWELEDLSVRCGTLTNGGEGWNTYAFPEPFEAPPVVVCQASGHQVEVGEVLADRFLYRLVSVTAEPVEVGYIAMEYGGMI